MSTQPVIEHLHRIVDFVSSGRFASEIESARKDYFSIVGDVFDDSPSFESRMISFLEWFILDRPIGRYRITSAALFFEEYARRLDEEARLVHVELLRNVHSIFIVTKSGGGRLILRDLADRKKYKVVGQNVGGGFAPGVVFEARLVRSGKAYTFTEGFCFHPPEVGKLIRKALKRVSKRVPEDKKRVILELASKSLRCEYARNIEVERLYQGTT